MKKKITMLIVVLALAFTACGNQPAVATLSSAESVPVSSDGIVAEGKLEPVRAVNLSFQVRGMVEEISVKIGDSVKKGDELARLANSDQALAQLTGANLELIQAQQAYDQFLRTEGYGRADAWTAYMDAQTVRAEAEREWEALNVE